jgi:hypothetical protein
MNMANDGDYALTMLRTSLIMCTVLAHKDIASTLKVIPVDSNNVSLNYTRQLTASAFRQVLAKVNTLRGAQLLNVQANAEVNANTETPSVVRTPLNSPLAQHPAVQQLRMEHSISPSSTNTNNSPTRFTKPVAIV